MNIQDLQFLFDYYYWGRDRILENVAKLSQAQYLEPKPYSHGSVHNTLVHILSAEWLWRMRCQEHTSPSATAATEAFPPPESLESLRQRWQQEEERMRSYLRGLSDQDLAGIVAYKRLQGEPQQNVLWHVLSHVVNHGTEHRSILAAELTAYGYSPGDLDLIRFTRVKSR
jgi:uncharacterized damage-inducible protein DinB